MKTPSSLRTVGLDLGDSKHSVCGLDGQGEILKENAPPQALTPAFACGPAL